MGRPRRRRVVMRSAAPAAAPATAQSTKEHRGPRCEALAGWRALGRARLHEGGGEVEAWRGLGGNAGRQNDGWRSGKRGGRRGSRCGGRRVGRRFRRRGEWRDGWRRVGRRIGRRIGRRGKWGRWVSGRGNGRSWRPISCLDSLVAGRLPRGVQCPEPRLHLRRVCHDGCARRLAHVEPLRRCFVRATRLGPRLGPRLSLSLRLKFSPRLRFALGLKLRLILRRCRLLATLH